jgi:hypothetical protein
VHQVHLDSEEGRYRECSFRRKPEAGHFDPRRIIA